MKKILTLMGLMLIVACSVLMVASCENTDWGEGDGDPTLLEYELSEDGTFYSVAGIGKYVGRHLVIPEEYNGLPVKEIGIWRFGSSENCAFLKAITIPDSIMNLGDMFFWKASVERINIGSGVKVIDDYAFLDTYNLKEINVSKDNQNFISKDGVLYSKDKTTLIKYPAQKESTAYKIPKSVTMIENNAFRDAVRLKRVKIGKNVTIIGSGAFENTSIKEIKIPKSVTVMGDAAFAGATKLKRVKIGKNVTTIGDYAFSETSIKTIKIPDSVESIGKGLFSECVNLRKVKLGEGITEIPQEMFYGCESLKKIFILINIEKIAGLAFVKCDNLTEVFYEGNENDWTNVSLDAKIYWGQIPEKATYPIFDESATLYCYSKDRPSGEGNYWRYVFWKPTVWKI
ncbi:MAG: leucine-rich repeat domain-containing protein [Clostridia bacterium]|nr:leucine-rich repeat domain-containing protein [Clostridia bacterium]